MGAEKGDAKVQVYLLPFARVLTARLNLGRVRGVTQLGGELVLDCVRNACENPIPQESNTGTPGQGIRRHC